MERIIKIEITVTDHKAMSDEEALTALLAGIKATMPLSTMACIDSAKTTSAMKMDYEEVRNLTPSLFDTVSNG